MATDVLNVVPGPGDAEQPTPRPRRTLQGTERSPVADPPDQADRRARPLSRRALMMARPARVDIRCRNPWRLARRRLFGWNGRFTHRLRCLSRLGAADAGRGPRLRGPQRCPSLRLPDRPGNLPPASDASLAGANADAGSRGPAPTRGSPGPPPTPASPWAGTPMRGHNPRRPSCERWANWALRRPAGRVLRFPRPAVLANRARARAPRGTPADLEPGSWSISFHRCGRAGGYVGGLCRGPGRTRP